MTRTARPPIDCRPLTPERWGDLERLFGPRGAASGCWCMWWRLTRAAFQRGAGEGNRRALRRLVDDGEVPGVLGYIDGEPVGWCAIEPRERYAVIERSRTKPRIDDKPVWCATCFFVARPHRGKGLMGALLIGAVAHARSRGASVVEGYPVAATRRLAPVSSFTGLATVFERAGFVEVARPTANRPIMRLDLGRPGPGEAG